MRFFIALEVPDQNRQELALVQKELGELIPSLKLTDSDKLHLTIAFVGEEHQSLAPKLTQVLSKASEAMSPFEVTPAYIDGFPNLHNPNTFWVGIKGDIDRLLLIRERVKDGLIDLNLDVDERRFIPHIAIGKVNNFNLSAEDEVGLEKIMAKNFSPIIVSSIKLFESTPDNGFHKHNTLAEILLQG